MPESVGLVWLTIALPFAGFLINGGISFKAPAAKNAVTAVGVGVLVGAFVTAVLVVNGLSSEAEAAPYIINYWSWIPVGGLSVDVALQVDQLSAVMLMVVTGVSLLIHIFSVGYMKSDPGYARYFAYLNLFVFFMLVLILGANFPLMFVGWEGVGLSSYLLIGFWYGEKANADAGKKAFIMNRIGDVGFLIAMFMIYQSIGSLNFVDVFEQAPRVMAVGGPTITLVTLALFLGCIGKSAQIPLYTWLPDAMAGPTPVSALIHAATMVTAGVYLVARSNILFAMAPLSSAVVAGVGALTALFAATIALKQWDIKKVLAYSTVSQLGYMFMAVGAGAYAAGIFHLVTHAFFKALLFLGAGSVIHAMHHAYHKAEKHDDPQDMRNMGALKTFMPWTAALMWIATLAIAGIPGFSGFFSKDGVLAAAFARGHEAPIYYVFWFLGEVTVLLTAFYMTRMMLYTFHGPNRTGDEESKHLHEAPWVMTGPLLVLGAGAALGGMLNLPSGLPGAGWLEEWLGAVTGRSSLYLSAGHLEEGTEWGLSALAAVIAIAGMLGAWRLLRPRELKRPDASPPEAGFQLVLAKKWYIDELYDAVIVRPVVWVSRRIFWKGVDAGLIDGVGVNGSAGLMRFFGWVGSRFQTGQVSTYVVIFVIGVLAILKLVTG